MARLKLTLINYIPLKLILKWITGKLLLKKKVPTPTQIKRIKSLLLPGGSGLLLLVRHLPPELRTQLQELVLVLLSLEGGTWKLG